VPTIVAPAPSLEPSARRAQLLGRRRRLGDRHGPPGQPTGQALAVNELRDVVEPLFGLPDVEDLHDARVTYPRQQAGLALEAARPLGIVRPPGLDQLDGHRALQPPVIPAVDAPESALADQGVKLVAVVQGAPG
jgi:hypothetical protein